MQKVVDPDLLNLTVADLEVLRQRLRLPKSVVCKKADINPVTYQRWMKYVRGERGGSNPRRSSVRAIREVLKEELAQRPTAAE